MNSVERISIPPGIERIYPILPLRPAVVRELVEELCDVDRTAARRMLNHEVTMGRMALGWDGKVHRGPIVDGT